MATTIAVAQETRELLRRLGEKGESYDRIINRLITDAGWSELDNRWNAILAEDEFIPLEELEEAPEVEERKLPAEAGEETSETVMLGGRLMRIIKSADGTSYKPL